MRDMQAIETRILLTAPDGRAEALSMHGLSTADVLRNRLLMPVAGETLVHTFRTKPAVELDRRTLGNERRKVVPLTGLIRNAFAPRAQIDDSLRTPEPLLHPPHGFVSLVQPLERLPARRGFVEDQHCPQYNATVVDDRRDATTYHPSHALP